MWEETSNDNLINESFQTIENTPCSYLVNPRAQNIENTSDVDELNQRTQATDNSTIPINHKQRRLLIENKKSLLVSIPRTTATHRQCFICKKYANRKLHRVTNSTIVDTFVQLNILIPFGSRCCSDHLNSNKTIKPDLFKKITICKTKSKVTSDGVKRLLDTFSMNAKNDTIFKK